MGTSFRGLKVVDVTSSSSLSAVVIDASLKDGNIFPWSKGDVIIPRRRNVKLCHRQPFIAAVRRCQPGVVASPSLYWVVDLSSCSARWCLCNKGF
ncbi:hypothetical protein V1264_018366 [Littorina saxatilis]|uniref:Uncharacterized protein n=1 Tax=Littorina saxatilis TaxID=31220 RepID=A0AAN9BCE2_9CAEN